MSTEESVISHLAQLDLKGDDEAILAGLKEWLSTAQFEEQGDEWELCTDSELPEKWKLLKKMDLAQKVQGLAVEIKESANTSLVHRTRIFDSSSTRSQTLAIQEYRRPLLRDTHSYPLRTPYG